MMHRYRSCFSTRGKFQASSFREIQLYPEQAIPQFPVSEQHPSYVPILSRFSVSLEALIKYTPTQG